MRWLAVVVVLAACGDEDGSGTRDTVADTSAGTDTGAGEDTSAGTDTVAGEDADASAATDAGADAVEDVASSCDHEGFTAVSQDFGSFGGYFLYLAQSSTGEPVSTLNMELVPDNGGATEAGEYPLSEADYATCGNCILIYQDCDANLDNCAKTFLAKGGTLNITSFGASGGSFAGMLDDVELIEVTIDDQLHSTPVADGETWCIDQFAFEATVQ